MDNTHPLSVLKFCPKCSSAKFSSSCNRSLKCPDCGFHYYLNSAAAVAALITNGEGKLLLTTRGIEPGYGNLDLPGGFVDPGETAEEAVSRELKEELGMTIKSMSYWQSAPNEYIFSSLTVYTLDMAFLVQPETFSELKAMDDILGFRFYAEEEIDFDRLPAPSIHYFVKNFFRK